jgi:putative ATP-dependent endonuclease of OLD family
MGILLKQIRVHGFRGLENIEIDLSPVTILVGSNNAGKTTLLRAIQFALGNSFTVSVDDFFYSNEKICDKIVIDTLFIPVDNENNQIDEFEDEWAVVLTTDRITVTTDGKQIMSFRTIVQEEPARKMLRKKQFYIDEWPLFIENEQHWYEVQFEKEFNFNLDEIPFYYIDANRDILDDIRNKTSYLGKLLSSIEYNAEDKQVIEDLIKELNKTTIDKSEVLTNLETTLTELDTTMDNPANTVSLTPFTKKVKDLNKGININYSEFTMDYHGMGTRSWSSLLVLKSFLNIQKQRFVATDKVYYPIMAVEEPEAHLHPNAQKKLYSQITGIAGQKIVSTHSNYVAGCGKLNEIRSLYKRGAKVTVNRIDEATLDPEEVRKINRHVVNTRGELFFSKAILLCEGETEEQALPLLIKKYFGKDIIELGIDVVGIGGGGNYYPFIHFAEALGIDWYILSDGEDKILKKLKKDIKKLTDSEEDVNLDDYSNIRYFVDGGDFEDYLISCGYQDEIETCLSTLMSATIDDALALKQGRLRARVKTDTICDTCKQNIYVEELRDYKIEGGRQIGLKDLLSDNKTKYAVPLSLLIAESEKDQPPKIVELFKEIKKALNKDGNG